MKEKKIKKPGARQNAKIEDKQLDQVQGGIRKLNKVHQGSVCITFGVVDRRDESYVVCR